MRLKKLREECAQLSVLLIDSYSDNGKIRDRLTKLFTKFYVTYTAQDALTKYNEYNDIFYQRYFDLIVINAYTIDDVRVVMDIKAINGNQKILVLGDFVSKTDFQTALAIGMEYYLCRSTSGFKQTVQTLCNVIDAISLKNRTENRFFLIDALTQLPNRRALLKQLETDDFSTIMIIDIDTIEYINLIYGYEVGNLVLKEFSQFLDSFCMDKKYTLYRVENQTFALYDTQKSMNFSEFEKNFNELLERTRFYKVKVLGIDIDFDTTIGIVICQTQAFVKANLALAKAKKENNRFFTYHNEFKVEQTIKVRDSINQAISNKQVIPFFQPIVDRNKQIIKYEALMRIRQDIDGEVHYISPDTFLDTAVKTRQYEALSTAMIEQVFEILENHNDIKISLNVSYYDIKEIKLLTTIQSFIEQKNSTVCSRLIIEMVETSDIAYYEYCSDFVKVAKRAGIKIAIDDFGTGYSNFTHVLNLQPDYLKIDGSLIKNIDKEEQSLVLVKAIVEFSKKLNINIIAEFVHNETIFDLLKELGVDEFQGYYLGEPKKEII